MTVKDFVNEYKGIKRNDKMKNEFVDKHITTKYINILTKESVCRSLVDASYHVTTNEIKIFKADSITLYILYNLKIIELYTDLDINEYSKNLYEAYDILNECGALVDIINTIPVTEISEFKQLLEMAIADLYDNEYSVVSRVDGIKNSIGAIATSLLDGISSAIEKYTENEEIIDE